jgi:hypothetical protein
MHFTEKVGLHWGLAKPLAIGMDTLPHSGLRFNATLGAYIHTLTNIRYCTYPKVICSYLTTTKCMCSPGPECYNIILYIVFQDKIFRAYLMLCP